MRSTRSASSGSARAGSSRRSSSSPAISLSHSCRSSPGSCIDMPVLSPVRPALKHTGQNGFVDRKEREAILGEWGIRDQSLIESAEERALDRDLEGSPLVGRPLPRRATLRPSVDSHVSSLGGPLPYMVRLHEIEAETSRHEQELEAAWRRLAEECASDAELFARRWRRT